MTCLVGLTSSAVHRESFDASRLQLANLLIKSSGFPETCGYGSHTAHHMTSPKAALRGDYASSSHVGT